MWSVRELDRNISTQYFERRLAAQLDANASGLISTSGKDPLEYIKYVSYRHGRGGMFRTVPFVVSA